MRASTKNLKEIGEVSR